MRSEDFKIDTSVGNQQDKVSLISSLFELHHLTFTTDFPTKRYKEAASGQANLYLSEWINNWADKITRLGLVRETVKDRNHITVSRSRC